MSEEEKIEEVVEEVTEEVVEEKPKKKKSSKKKKDASGGRVIGNASEKGACRVGGITFAPKGEEGDSHALDTKQQSNQSLMARFARAVGNGILEWR